MMPKGRERHKQVVKHKRLPKSVRSKENHKNSVFHAVFYGFENANLVLAVGALPLDPRLPFGSIISRRKCELLMRPRAAVGMVCQRWREHWSKPFKRDVTL